jgi:hypothetical protein
MLEISHQLHSTKSDTKKQTRPDLKAGIVEDNSFESEAVKEFEPITKASRGDFLAITG